MITSHNFQGKYLRKISLNWPPRMITDSELWKCNFRLIKIIAIIKGNYRIFEFHFSLLRIIGNGSKRLRIILKLNRY